MGTNKTETVSGDIFREAGGSRLLNIFGIYESEFIA
jgi:hypothetical protein